MALFSFLTNNNDSEKVVSLSTEETYQLELKQALEDQFRDLETLDVEEVIRDLKSLQDIQEEQTQWHDKLSTLKQYVLEMVAKFLVSAIATQDQDLINKIYATFGYDADSEVLQKDIFEIYESVTSLDDEYLSQDEVYKAIKNRLKKEHLREKQNDFKEKVEEQVQEYKKSLEGFAVLYTQFDALPTPDVFEKKLIDSLKSSKGNIGSSGKFVAEQTKDHILVYRKTREEKSKQIENLRAHLLTSRTKLEKVSFGWHIEKAESLLAGIKNTDSSVFEADMKAKVEDVLTFFEYWEEEILRQRQDVKLYSSLDVDITQVHYEKVSWQYHLGVYKAHAHYLAKKRNIKLGIDQDAIQEVGSYLASELEILGKDKERIQELYEILIKEDVYTRYANPHLINFMLLLEKHASTRGKIRTIVQYQQQKDGVGDSDVFLLWNNIATFLETHAGIKNPFQKQCLRMSADHLIELSDRKSLIVKEGMMYTMNTPEIPLQLLAKKDLLEEYISISIEPLHTEVKTHEALRDTKSDVNKKMHMHLEHSSIKDNIQDRYDITLQDASYVYNIDALRIEEFSEGTTIQNILKRTIHDHSITEDGEYIFNKPKNLKSSYLNGICVEEKNHNDFRFLNVDGISPNEQIYIQIFPPSHGLRTVQIKEGQRMYLDKDLKNKFDETYFDAEPFQEGLGIIKNAEGKYEYRDLSGKNPFGKSFASAESFHEGLGIVSTPKWNGKRFYHKEYIDMSGENPFNKSYPEVSHFVNGIACVKVKENSYMYIDKNGKQLFGTNFFNARSFDETGKAWVNKSEYGTSTNIYVNNSGEISYKPRGNESGGV